MEEDEELGFDTSTMPPFDFRVNSVKLLLEVGLYERALDVIDTLVSVSWLTARRRRSGGCSPFCEAMVVCSARWRMTTKWCRSGTCAAGPTTS